MRRHLFTLLYLLLLALPAAAQEADSPPARLRFYSHPTERYNILAPSGWDNLSDERGAHFVNTSLAAEIYARAFVTEDVDDAARQAVLLLPAEVLSVTSGDDVRLVTGAWSQRFFRLSSGGVATAFVQLHPGRAFVILYFSQSGAIPMIVRTDGPIADANGAQAAFEYALAQLGLNAQPASGMTEPPPDATTVLTFGRSFSSEGQRYVALVRGAGDTSADVLIEPGPAFSGDHTIVYSVVRDFFLTPDTASYLWLGLAAVCVFMAGFVASIIIRQRNLHADEAALAKLTQPQPRNT